MMVNPGHASKGCTTCKVRRIRCDYGRPFCLRCAKSKRVCLGYNTKQKQAIAFDKSSSIHDNVVLTIQPSAPLGRLARSHSLSKFYDHEGHQKFVLAHIGFLFNGLAVTGTDNVAFQPPGRNFCLDPGNGEEQLGRVAWSVLSTLSQGFCTLQQPVQTMEARKDLLELYGSATRLLREALAARPTSPTLFMPVFLFSLYEMIVNINPTDRTWQSHLSGLLSIFRLTPGRNTKMTLLKAIEISDSETDVHKALESSATNNLERACLLLDIVKIQLRKLVAEVDAVVNNSPLTLRKLDLQKLGVSIKQIRKHLNLFPIILRDSVNSTAAVIDSDGPLSANQINSIPQSIFVSDLLMMRWSDFHTLQIMTATVLLKIGSFLYPNGTYCCTREFTTLSKTIQEAVDGICSSTTYYTGSHFTAASDRSETPTIKKIHGLMLIWPLCCASIAPGLTERQQNWLRAALWMIGERCSIPKALSLAGTMRENISQSDILAGILVVSLVFILPYETFL